MKIFVAGASGAIGSRLVLMLVERGHGVAGVTRTAANAAAIEAAGAGAVVADVLDPEAVDRAVAEFGPDAIVHQATALKGEPDMRRFDRYFELTNRLRTRGTENLLSAGRAAGVARFVAQSFAGWPYARTGGPVKTEEDPLDPEPAAGASETHAAIRTLEQLVLGADWTEGIVLRYGGFYGPGTSLAKGPEGEIVRLLRGRKLPLVGGGKGVWSFVHIDDAAAATVAALERGRRGIYNVVDDEPAPVAEWLPALAEAVGAKPPLRIPKWLGRLAAGEVATRFMTEIRGASNEKARRELGWAPRHPSWRSGFAEAI